MVKQLAAAVIKRDMSKIHLILFFDLASMLGGNEVLPGGFKPIKNKNVKVEYFE